MPGTTDANPPPPPRSTPHPFRRRVWKTVGLLAVFFATLQACGPLLSKPGNRLPPVSPGGDLLIAYAAGTLVREKQFDELHDPAAFIKRINELAVDAGKPPFKYEVGPWLNPPFFLWPFVALSLLPFWVAFGAYTAFSLSSLALATFLLARMLRPAPPPRHLKLIDYDAAAPGPAVDWRTWSLIPVLACLSIVGFETLVHGQHAMVALMLLTGAVALWRAERGYWAGVVLGLLFFKPQLALVVAAVMTLDLGRRAVLGIGTTGTVLVVASALVMPEELSLYLRHSSSAAAQMQVDGIFPWHRHVTFTAFWRLLIQGPRPAATWPSPLALGAACALALVAPLLIAVARHRRPALATRADRAAAARRRDRLSAAAVASTPMVMPYYMDYDLLLLAVPAVLFAREWVARAHTGLSPTRGDVWLRRGWVAAYLWLYANPGFAVTTRLNLTVPLLALLAGGLIVRAMRRDDDALATGAESSDAATDRPRLAA